jgi:transcriptional regulator GlxA family with amidase domain
LPLDDTDLDIADVAFASGFGSLRQFNGAMSETFDVPPGEAPPIDRPGIAPGRVSGGG